MTKARIDHGRVKPFFYNRFFETEGWWKYYRHHPLEPFRMLYDLVTSAWHRAKWGWDTTDTWSLDTHLATILPPMLRNLRNGVSYSSYIRVAGKVYEAGEDGELYMAMLESCAQALETYAFVRQDMWPLPDTEYERQAYIAAQLALVMIAENFGTLWD